jgi:hypothetical protein
VTVIPDDDGPARTHLVIEQAGGGQRDGQAMVIASGSIARPVFSGVIPWPCCMKDPDLELAVGERSGNSRTSSSGLSTSSSITTNNANNRALAVSRPSTR